MGEKEEKEDPPTKKQAPTNKHPLKKPEETNTKPLETNSNRPN
jgi:hypothetical protein